MIEVTVTVDFGPADKPRVEQIVTIADKSTVLDALTAVLPVLTVPKYGMDHFTEAIDGVKNDLGQDFGWHFEVNGYRANVPAERYLLKNGDWIRWLYIG
jgi:hypothetical protein